MPPPPSSTQPLNGVINHVIVVDLSRYNHESNNDKSNSKYCALSISTFEHELQQLDLLDALEGQIKQHATLCMADKYSQSYPYTLPNIMTVDWKGNIEWIFYSYNPMSRLYSIDLSEGVRGISQQYDAYKEALEQQQKQEGAAPIDTNVLYNICSELDNFVLERQKEQEQRYIPDATIQVTWFTSIAYLGSSADGVKTRVYNTLEQLSRKRVKMKVVQVKTEDQQQSFTATPSSVLHPFVQYISIHPDELAAVLNTLRHQHTKQVFIHLPKDCHIGGVNNTISVIIASTINHQPKLQSTYVCKEHVEVASVPNFANLSAEQLAKYTRPDETVTCTRTQEEIPVGHIRNAIQLTPLVSTSTHIPLQPRGQAPAHSTQQDKTAENTRDAWDVNIDQIGSLTVLKLVHGMDGVQMLNLCNGTPVMIRPAPLVEHQLALLTFGRHLHIRNQMAVAQSSHYTCSYNIQLKKHFLIYTSMPVSNLTSTSPHQSNEERGVELFMKPIACNEMVTASTLHRCISMSINERGSSKQRPHNLMPLSHYLPTSSSTGTATASIIREAEDIINVSTPHMLLNQVMELDSGIHHLMLKLEKYGKQVAASHQSK